MRKTLMTIGAAALLALPAVPASAAPASSDCRIFGPAYVSEVVDCVVFLYTTLIGQPGPA